MKSTLVQLFPDFEAAQLLTDSSRFVRKPSASSRRPIAILGVPFDNVTAIEALQRIEAMIASRRPHYVVTANVDFLTQARRDVELHRIFLEADLVLCDGAPILWASRWLGNPLPERVAGSDVVPLLLRQAAEKGHRVFLLGAGPGVAAEAAARLQREMPALNIAGHHAPPFCDLLEMDHQEICQRVRAARPDLLLVSFGCPKQEKWIAMHLHALGVPVAIGVGGTLDFLASRLKRAPGWMRKSGLEWVYRLWQEPRRLFLRYAGDLLHFLPALVLQWWELRAKTGADGWRTPPNYSLGDHWLQVRPGERLVGPALFRDAEFWRDVMNRPHHCLLNLSQVRSIDSTGLALLADWRKRLRAKDRRFILYAPSPAVRHALRLARLEEHFTIIKNWAEMQQEAAQLDAPPPPVTAGNTASSLSWQGEVTAANADEVWELTMRHWGAFDRDRGGMVIDLSGVRFIDSTGVGLMLRVWRWGQEHEREISFTDAQPSVRNVLSLTRPESLLHRAAS